jgi:hypothetical protein
MKGSAPFQQLLLIRNRLSLQLPRSRWINFDRMLGVYHSRLVDRQLGIDFFNFFNLLFIFFWAGVQFLHSIECGDSVKVLVFVERVM